MNGALDRVETLVAGSIDSPLPQPPIFIVGPPRSGSTVLYQLVVGCFDVGYLSNRHCRLYGAPSLAERIRHPEPPPELESRYGRTAGPDAPSECGDYWYRFFRRSPQFVPRGEADPEKLRRLRASVRALGKAAGRPLVFKNLICALRLGPFSEALPEAVFVRMRRDMRATAVSLLAGRKALYGDYAHWWSSEPPGIERLRRLPPHEQVVEQIAAVETLIDQARDEVGPERFCELTYEGLCEDPAAALGTIAALAERNGFRLSQRRPAASSLEQAEPQPIDDDLQDKLAAYIRDR